MSELGIPINIEKSEISVALNSTILLVFLMGMYATIYCGTIYIYFTRNFANHHLVPVTITILFLTITVQTGFEWYLTKWQFIDNGDTRDSVFLALGTSPQWVDIGIITTTGIEFVLADALLIWRCYVVWNRSVRIMLVPLLLITTEAALFFTQVVLNIVFSHATVSLALATSFNDLLAAAYFTSFATSLSATILIAYRIYSVLKHEGTSTRRFQHIVDIVVQSGALYSLSLLVNAISGVVPGSNDILNTRTMALESYAQCIAIPIAGISTTILVARVALLAPDTTYPSTSVHISGLRFHARSTQYTNPREGMEAIHSITIDRNIRGKEQEIEGGMLMA